MKSFDERMFGERNMRKGQYFSFDAITGLLIFIISIGILVTYWHNIQHVMQTQDSSSIVVALRISDMLFTEGYPKDWNDPSHSIEEIYMIGLMTNGSIDPNKIIRLNDLMTGPEEDETILKMKTGGYNFQVIFSGGYSTVIGDPPDCNTTVTTFTRMAPVKFGTATVAADVTVRVWACPV